MKNPHWLYFLLLFTAIFFTIKKVRASENPPHKSATSVSNKTFSKSKFGRWDATLTNDASGRICYIFSKPIDSSGNHKEKRNSYMMISIFDKSIKEISINSDGGYKLNSKLSVSIDGTQMNFVAENPNIAWPEKYNSDEIVINKMLKGFKILVFSEFNAGTYAVDVYSLEGMREAYNNIINLCAK